LSEAELACLSRVDPLPSSEAETERAAGGLGGEASSEAETICGFEEALDGLFRGVGPWAECGFGLFGT